MTAQTISEAHIYPHCLTSLVAPSGHSITICWMNKWINEANYTNLCYTSSLGHIIKHYIMRIWLWKSLNSVTSLRASACFFIALIPMYSLVFSYLFLHKIPNFLYYPPTFPLAATSWLNPTCPRPHTIVFHIYVLCSSPSNHLLSPPLSFVLCYALHEDTCISV